jgi:hypothetical protein
MALLKQNKPDPKVPFPRSVGEAKALIAETFAAKGNNWDEREQAWYLNSLGITVRVSEMDQHQTRIVLNALGKLRMILFTT